MFPLLLLDLWTSINDVQWVSMIFDLPTDKPTMSDNFYLIMSDFLGSFWTYLPTLTSDVINGRSPGYYVVELVSERAAGYIGLSVSLPINGIEGANFADWRQPIHDGEVIVRPHSSSGRKRTATQRAKIAEKVHRPTSPWGQCHQFWSKWV